MRECRLVFILTRFYEFILYIKCVVWYGSKTKQTKKYNMIQYVCAAATCAGVHVRVCVCVYIVSRSTHSGHRQPSSLPRICFLLQYHLMYSHTLRRVCVCVEHRMCQLKSLLGISELRALSWLFVLLRQTFHGNPPQTHPKPTHKTRTPAKAEP